MLPTPDFTLSVSNPQSIPQGTPASYQVSVAAVSGSGFSGTVKLSMGAITGGVTGSVSPSASPGSPATLTLNATNTATLGTYPILVTATNASGTIVVAAVEHAAHLGHLLQIPSHSVFNQFVGRSAALRSQFVKAGFGFGSEMYVHVAKCRSVGAFCQTACLSRSIPAPRRLSFERPHEPLSNSV